MIAAHGYIASDTSPPVAIGEARKRVGTGRPPYGQRRVSWQATRIIASP